MKRLVETFKVISEETRLRLYNLLIITEKELNGTILAEAIQKPQYAVSKHINFLVRSGLVNARRESQKIFYSISPLTKNARMDILKLFDSLCDDASIFREDLSRLKNLDEKTENS